MDPNEAQASLHRLEMLDGMIAALDQYREVTETIASSDDRLAAITALRDLLDVGEIGARAAAAMHWGRLTRDTRASIEQERHLVLRDLADLETHQFDRPLLEFAALSIDAADAAALARFYVAAFGALSKPARNGWHYAVLPGGLELCFRTVEGYTRPAWGTPGAPMQMHVECYVDDLDHARARLEALGATTPDYQPELATGLVVMLDPSGHPFCIFTRPQQVTHR
ncbi:VOC family protein [Pseudonocardia sp.]|uniref:VOC family protein n=1 Tax=Pseudonocardia sp. TaxID=60912 RepID=UPI003D0C8984